MASASRGPRAALWLMVMLTLTGGGLRAWSVARHVAVDYDEGRYLDNARNILEGRGLSSSYTSHFFRTAPPLHPEDISAPLYPWLLAATFRVTGVELRPAQAWSWLAGTSLIPLTFLLGRRLFGEAAGAFAAGLVAFNPDMVIISSWAMTEMLYAALLLGILLLADVDEDPPAQRRPGRLLMLGIACGLLYLLRANGLAVAAALGVWSLLPVRRETWKGIVSLPRLLPAVALSAGFLVCVSPWLARNQALFGSPTYTAMKNVAWSERGTDLFTRDKPPSSMQSFAQEHGAAGLARHLAHRAARACGFLIWGDTGAFNIFCALFPLAAAMTWSMPRARPGILAALFSTLLLAGVPLWTGAPSRYLLPVRPVIYAVVAGAAFSMMGRLAGRAPAAIAGALVLAVSLASAAPLRDWLESDQGARDAICREAADFVAARTPPGSVILEGALLHQYTYLFDRPVVWAPTGGLPEIERAARDYGARYLAVSAELLGTRPELKEIFDVGASRDVTARALPAGWTELFAGSGRRIVIYALAPEAG